MSKNIVICLDGTGNQFNEHNSNVVKMFRVLVRNQEQIVYYDSGVGTLADSSFKTPVGKRISKWLGLGLGVGLLKNVEEAYSYLMEKYEQNDRVFIFGFSRGAYTARVLAGLIHGCGLLEPGNQALIPYALKLYGSSARLSWIRGRDELPFEVLGKFKSTFSRSIDIHFLGLWDSVSTFGWIYNPVFLPFTTNNKGVRAVRHALAIDEKRSFFQPMPWGLKHADSQDIKQVWFAGVHSDVGGGYAEEESGLAKIALEWMLAEASDGQFRLLVDREKVDRYIYGKNGGGYAGPDSEGKSHESLKGSWWLVQFMPRSIWCVGEERSRIRFPKQIREVKKGAAIHQSVMERVSAREYWPKNLEFDSVSNFERNYVIEKTRWVQD